MGRKLKTTEEFISDAIDVHGYKYDYSKVDYTGAHNKVCIICKKHGEFKKPPTDHLSGEQGCPQCSIEISKEKRKIGKNKFVKKAKEKHGDKYCYDKVKYKNCDTKVVIKCPKHGVFFQTPYNHINRNQSCPTCSVNDKKKTEKEFIKESKLLHDNKYDYSNVNYINNTTKVKIICPIHGQFNKRPLGHLCGEQGCPSCAIEKRNEERTKTTNEFINEAKEIHKNKYDYSRTKYVKSNIKIEIICPKHGLFKQAPENHLRGHGCFECGINSMLEYQKKQPSIWKYGDWVESSKESDNFDSYKVYVVKLFKDDEEFYKIGKTYTSISKRFASIPYNYEILKIIESSNGHKICKLEVKLQNKHKNYKYLPNINFDGMRECFYKYKKDIDINNLVNEPEGFVTDFRIDSKEINEKINK